MGNPIMSPSLHEGQECREAGHELEPSDAWDHHPQPRQLMGNLRTVVVYKISKGLKHGVSTIIPRINAARKRDTPLRKG